MADAAIELSDDVRMLAATASPTSPCSGCPKAHRCARLSMACAQFLAFSAGAPAKRWRLAPKVPEARIFRMLFD
jgi:hypothetical protein